MADVMIVTVVIAITYIVGVVSGICLQRRGYGPFNAQPITYVSNIENVRPLIREEIAKAAPHMANAIQALAMETHRRRSM